MRQVFLKFNSTGMPSCLSVQWEPISSIGVAFRSSISVIAAITLITVSLQENKCNCHVCPSVQRNKCYNAIFAKAPHWPHCHHWNFSTCQNLHFKGSEKVRWPMISIKKIWLSTKLVPKWKWKLFDKNPSHLLPDRQWWAFSHHSREISNEIWTEI